MTTLTMPRPLPAALRPEAGYSVPTHLPSSELFGRRLRIALVGCGGTGSQVLTGLGRIYLSLKRLAEESDGHVRQMEVDVWDPDIVSEYNIGQQLFAPGDIRQPKAFCLVGRVNLAYGTNWRGLVRPYDNKYVTEQNLKYDILISCVDTARTRRELHAMLFDRKYEYSTPSYWMDCGNTLDRGQVIIGEPRRDPKEEGFSPHLVPDMADIYWRHSKQQHRYSVSGKVASGPMLRLPCVTELYPELLDESVPENNTPSCSMVEALGRQDLFVNQMVATMAEHLLWKLIHGGGITCNGGVFNLTEMTMNPKPLRLWPLKAPKDAEGVLPPEWLL